MEGKFGFSSIYYINGEIQTMSLFYMYAFGMTEKKSLTLPNCSIIFSSDSKSPSPKIKRPPLQLTYDILYT